jgi:hypothetical protein
MEKLGDASTKELLTIQLSLIREEVTIFLARCKKLSFIQHVFQ